FGWRPQAVECRALRGTERLVTRRAEKALVLARVDANVALAGLASGGAGQIRAECCCGVHASILRVALGNVPRGSMPEPPFSWQAHHTTVKCGATQHHRQYIKDDLTVARGAELLELPTTTFHLLVVLLNLGTLFVVAHDPRRAQLLIGCDQNDMV